MLVSAAWIVPAAFAALDRYAQVRLNGSGPIGARDLLFQAGDWFLYAFLTPFVFVVSRRWPLARPHLARNACIHLLVSLLFCVAWATAGKVFQFALGYAFTPVEFHWLMALPRDEFWSRLVRDWLSWVFTTFPFGVAVYLCMVGIEHATRYFFEARDRQVQLARVSEQLTSAKLAALQARLNPHFLFNSLNTINVLVRDGDRHAATTVIEHLSEVLRTTLSRSRESEVSLDDELALVHEYLSVEQARFSDRLRVEFDVDPGLLSAAVPSFAVQHLVENAVRHGIARRTDAGWIRVRARRDHQMVEITVEDDGPGIGDAPTIPPGHGLASTRERLHTMYGERASVELAPRADGGAVGRLRIPYREVLLDARPDAEA